MARIRTIKPSFFRHGELFDAERACGLPLRVAYAGLWTIADREGRFKYKPRDIKVEVLPYDDVDMVEVLGALEAKGFIKTYSSEGQNYAYIPAFSDHQHVNKNEPQSQIPAPSKNIPKRAKKVRAPSPQDEEGKGKEGNDISFADAPFERFYLAYPRRQSRGAAEKAFAKAGEITDHEVLIAAAHVYAGKRLGQEAQYTMLPATWLNQKCWLDEGIAPAKTEASSKPVHPSWNGHEAPLRAAIGNPNFEAYFADYPIENDIFFAPTDLRKELIEKKFSSHLHILGITVEVRA